MDWLKLCPPAAPNLEEFDLAGPTGRLALDESGIGGGAESRDVYLWESPYKGSQSQSDEQKADLIATFSGRLAAVGSTDYVAGWFIRGRDYMDATASKSAFVTTNSLNQGRQVATLRPLLSGRHTRILFARRSFKWSNLAAQKAGVTVSIVCFGKPDASARYLISDSERQAVDKHSPYLVGGPRLRGVEVQSAGELAADEFWKHAERRRGTSDVAQAPRHGEARIFRPSKLHSAGRGITGVYPTASNDAALGNGR